MSAYCSSRFQAVRFPTRAVDVGGVGIGGDNPIRVQSMTTTDTMDVDATVKQAIALAEVGCEIIRITAPSTKAAAALADIRNQFRAAGFDQPLVADIHFTPKAALEAANHVEKVRVNPGNYADRKKFQVREYSDDQYEEELQRLYDAFSPLVLRCKELGRAIRIGTNHGSLSDRIMNRYGDTPLGMVESALEFIRIAESHGFREIVLSMKASNPKVMIEAYRLAVAKMREEDMAYPLHLGVTEAGDGEDARIKSTVGIGSLLYDGLGDTIRVSLTEDPVYEIPVAREMAARAMQLWKQQAAHPLPENEESRFDSIDPFSFKRRRVPPVEVGPDCTVADSEPPRVWIRSHLDSAHPREVIKSVAQVHSRLRDSRIEGLLLPAGPEGVVSDSIRVIREALGFSIKSLVLDFGESFPDRFIDSVSCSGDADAPRIIPASILKAPDSLDRMDSAFAEWLSSGQLLALSLEKQAVTERTMEWLSRYPGQVILSIEPDPRSSRHPLGQYRHLAETLKQHDIDAPIWIRSADASAIGECTHPGDRLIEASLLAGPLICDGLGDILSVENEPDMVRATSLAYNILQGSRARISKTEFVACPSCGRTLFDLQSTTQRIRAQTHHLKGVTIAIMGCIVNGPGEMADADFGYVGGAPGKVNLYVGKTPVKYNVPEAEAVDRLVDLIREHGKWVEPPEEDSAGSEAEPEPVRQS